MGHATLCAALARRLQYICRIASNCFKAVGTKGIAHQRYVDECAVKEWCPKTSVLRVVVNKSLQCGTVVNKFTPTSFIWTQKHFFVTFQPAVQTGAHTPVSSPDAGAQWPAAAADCGSGDLLPTSTAHAAALRRWLLKMPRLPAEEQRAYAQAAQPVARAAHHAAYRGATKQPLLVQVNGDVVESRGAARKR